MVGLDYQASLNTVMIGPASDTGFGLVASARSCRATRTYWKLGSRISS